MSQAQVSPPMPGDYSPPMPGAYSPPMPVGQSPQYSPDNDYMDKVLNYSTESQNGQEFKTYFDLTNIPVALANALRRSFSSLCPTVTFDDSYESKSIDVISNTSSLHNEFITHRLSLIPINMDNNPNILFETNFNKRTGKREYMFSNESEIPVFSLNIKNDASNSARRDKAGIIDVSTEDFTVKLGEDDELENSVFFQKDLFTGEPILINKLKSNISDDNEGEEMIINCYPRIGLGTNNSRHDPTGTVTYEFRIDNQEKVDRVFKDKMSVLQKERVAKGYSPLSEEEIAKHRASFNLLDIQRVYTQNDKGDPDYFMFSVESIGFLHPSQIVVDSVQNLILVLGDIKNSVSFLDNEGSIKLETNEKVTIENYKSKTTDGVLVKVNDENHTVGNLVQHYLRDMFLADRNTPDNLLSIASYRMPHPTIEEIEFILVPNNDISIDHMISHIVSKMPYDIKDSDKLSESKRLTIIHTYLVSLLIDSIDKTTKQLTNFLEIFKMKSGITSTTYTINE